MLPKKQRPMYWSRFSTYENCSQEYLWKYGWGDIDLGAGPGKPKPSFIQESEHNTITGRVMSYILEQLYNQELYKSPTTLLDTLDELARVELRRQLQKSYIDWNKADSHASMERDVLYAIRNLITTMKGQRLLGNYAKSEVDLIGWIQKGKYPIGGRADLILRQDPGGISIWDGKMTKWKEKYSDPDQLLWYALCFYLAYKILPERLGWIWFRFPYGSTDEESGETELGITEISFTEQDILDLSTRAIEAHDSLNAGVFFANPVPSHCKFCTYQTVCPERIEQRAQNSKKRDKTGIIKLTEDLDVFEIGDLDVE